jgi:hypothetical protein
LQQQIAKKSLSPEISAKTAGFQSATFSANTVGGPQKGPYDARIMALVHPRSKRKSKKN